MLRAFKHIALIAAFVIGAFALNPTSALAAQEGWYPKIVDFDFMKEHAVIPVRTDVVIIDSRPMKRRYNKGHIPGAISIPNSSFDNLIGRLPTDKNMLLVFYCGGPKCMLSHKSAFKAEALGYTNIKVYADGMPDWKAKGQFASMSADVVKGLIDKKKAMVYDARPLKRKYAKGHVPGAIGMPFSQFDKMTNLLPADKAVPVVFYCGGLKCKLSLKSALKAKEMGYSNVSLFQGGYPEWKKAFGDGVKGMEPFAMAAKAGTIEAGEDGDTITLASFKGIMKDAPDSVYLYDVRDAEEFAKGSLPGAVSLPVEDLEDKVAGLPDDKPIIFVCSTGARSGEAYDIVKMAREEMKVFFLDATITYHGEGKYELAQN